MRCPKCNTENENGAKFCAGCGSSMSNLINTNRNNMPNNNLSLKKNRKNVRKKIITICACVLASLIVVGGVGILIYASKYAGTIAYDDGKTLISKEALAIGTERSNSKVLSYNENDGKITIGSKQSSIENDEEIGINEDINELHVGSIIANGGDENAPYGFLKKVVAININPDGTKTVSTQDAALTDAIAKCNISVVQGDVSYSGSSVASLFAEKAYAASYDNTFSLFHKDFELGSCTNASFDVDVVFHLEIDFFKLIDCTVKLVPKASLSISASYQNSWSKNENIFTKELPSIKFSIGCVPIVIVNKFSLDIGASLSVSANASIDSMMECGIEIGASYSKDNGVNPIFEIQTPDPHLTANAEANLDIAASVTPSATLSSKLYDVAGVSATIALKLDGGFSLKLCTALEAQKGSLKIQGSDQPWKGSWKMTAALPITANFVLGGGPIDILAGGQNTQKSYKIHEWNSAPFWKVGDTLFPDSDTKIYNLDEDYGEETGETEKRELIGGDFIG